MICRARDWRIIKALQKGKRVIAVMNGGLIYVEYYDKEKLHFVGYCIDGYRCTFCGKEALEYIIKDI